MPSNISPCLLPRTENGLDPPQGEHKQASNPEFTLAFPGNPPASLTLNMDTGESVTSISAKNTNKTSRESRHPIKTSPKYEFRVKPAHVRYIVAGDDLGANSMKQRACLSPSLESLSPPYEAFTYFRRRGSSRGSPSRRSSRSPRRRLIPNISELTTLCENLNLSPESRRHQIPEKLSKAHGDDADETKLCQQCRKTKEPFTDLEVNSSSGEKTAKHSRQGIKQIFNRFYNKTKSGHESHSKSKYKLHKNENINENKELLMATCSYDTDSLLDPHSSLERPNLGFKHDELRREVEGSKPKSKHRVMDHMFAEVMRSLVDSGNDKKNKEKKDELNDDVGSIAKYYCKETKNDDNMNNNSMFKDDNNDDKFGENSDGDFGGDGHINSECGDTMITPICEKAHAKKAKSMIISSADNQNISVSASLDNQVSDLVPLDWSLQSSRIKCNFECYSNDESYLLYKLHKCLKSHDNFQNLELAKYFQYIKYINILRSPVDHPFTLQSCSVTPTHLAITNLDCDVNNNMQDDDGRDCKPYKGVMIKIIITPPTPAPSKRDPMDIMPSDSDIDVPDTRFLRVDSVPSTSKAEYPPEKRATAWKDLDRSHLNTSSGVDMNCSATDFRLVPEQIPTVSNDPALEEDSSEDDEPAQQNLHVPNAVQQRGTTVNIEPPPSAGIAESIQDPGNSAKGYEETAHVADNKPEKQVPETSGKVLQVESSPTQTKPVDYTVEPEVKIDYSSKNQVQETSRVSQIEASPTQTKPLDCTAETEINIDYCDAADSLGKPQKYNVTSLSKLEMKSDIKQVKVSSPSKFRKRSQTPKSRLLEIVNSMVEKRKSETAVSASGSESKFSESSSSPLKGTHLKTSSRKNPKPLPRTLRKFYYNSRRSPCNGKCHCFVETNHGICDLDQTLISETEDTSSKRDYSDAHSDESTSLPLSEAEPFLHGARCSDHTQAGAANCDEGIQVPGDCHPPIFCLRINKDNDKSDRKKSPVRINRGCFRSCGTLPIDSCECRSGKENDHCSQPHDKTDTEKSVFAKLYKIKHKHLLNNMQVNQKMKRHASPTQCQKCEEDAERGLHRVENLHVTATNVFISQCQNMDHIYVDTEVALKSKDFETTPVCTDDTLKTDKVGIGFKDNIESKDDLPIKSTTSLDTGKSRTTQNKTTDGFPVIGTDNQREGIEYNLFDSHFNMPSHELTEDFERQGQIICPECLSIPCTPCEANEKHKTSNEDCANNLIDLDIVCHPPDQVTQASVLSTLKSTTIDSHIMDSELYEDKLDEFCHCFIRPRLADSNDSLREEGQAPDQNNMFPECYECPREVKSNADEVSGQCNNEASTPNRTQSLVMTPGENKHTDSAVSDIVAFISEEVNIKRYPSFTDLTDLAGESPIVADTAGEDRKASESSELESSAKIIDADVGKCLEEERKENEDVQVTSAADLIINDGNNDFPDNNGSESSGLESSAKLANVGDGKYFEDDRKENEGEKATSAIGLINNDYNDSPDSQNPGEKCIEVLEEPHYEQPEDIENFQDGDDEVNKGNIMNRALDNNIDSSYGFEQKMPGISGSDTENSQEKYQQQEPCSSSHLSKQIEIMDSHCSTATLWSQISQEVRQIAIIRKLPSPPTVTPCVSSDDQSSNQGCPPAEKLFEGLANIQMAIESVDLENWKLGGCIGEMDTGCRDGKIQLNPPLNHGEKKMPKENMSDEFVPRTLEYKPLVEESTSASFANSDTDSTQGHADGSIFDQDPADPKVESEANRQDDIIEIKNEVNSVEKKSEEPVQGKELIDADVKHEVNNVEKKSDEAPQGKEPIDTEDTNIIEIHCGPDDGAANLDEENEKVEIIPFNASLIYSDVVVDVANAFQSAVEEDVLDTKVLDTSTIGIDSAKHVATPKPAPTLTFESSHTPAAEIDIERTGESNGNRITPHDPNPLPQHEENFPTLGLYHTSTPNPVHAMSPLVESDNESSQSPENNSESKNGKCLSKSSASSKVIKWSLDWLKDGGYYEENDSSSNCNTPITDHDGEENKDEEESEDSCKIVEERTNMAAEAQIPLEIDVLECINPKSDITKPEGDTSACLTTSRDRFRSKDLNCDSEHYVNEHDKSHNSMYDRPPIAVECNDSIDKSSQRRENSPTVDSNDVLREHQNSHKNFPSILRNCCGIGHNDTESTTTQTHRKITNESPSTSVQLSRIRERIQSAEKRLAEGDEILSSAGNKLNGSTWRLKSYGNFVERSQRHLKKCDELLERSTRSLKTSTDMIARSKIQLETTAAAMRLLKLPCSSWK